MSSVLGRSREIDASMAFPQVVPDVLDRLRDRQLGPCRAIPTPFPSLNKACRGTGGGIGLGPGWFTVIAGQTGFGKTNLALNFVHAAQRAGVNVAFVSLELGRDEILIRYRPIVSGLDVLQVEQGSHFKPEIAEQADRAILDLPGSLFINPDPIAELRDIAGAMAELARTEKVWLLVVDYVQLVSTAGRDSELFARMAEVSAELRLAARRTGVAVLALSQLNRARERGAPPTIENLFGSSRFGFDSDLVLALDYTKSDRDPIRRTTRLVLRTLKTRHGPAVVIPVEFSTATLRFTEVETDDRSGWSNR